MYGWRDTSRPRQMLQDINAFSQQIFGEMSILINNKITHKQNILK